MRDKRDVMRLHLRNGVSGLNDIRDSYNTYSGTQPGSNQMEFSLSPEDYSTTRKPYVSPQERQQIEYNKFKQTNPTFQQPVAKPTGADEAGQFVQDMGSRTLNALTTFGGSAIGDAINDISPTAANAVSKYSLGMIQPTSQEYLESNRSNDKTDNWNNRLNNAANSISSQLSGEMIGAGINKGIKLVENGIANKTLDKEINNLASIYDNAVQNQPTIRDASLNVLKGSSEARNFINSDAVITTMEKNNLLADRIGIQNNPNPYKQKPGLQSKFVENFNDKIGKTNSPGATENIGALFDPNNNEMLFRKSVTPSVSFHENLHSYGYGKKPIQDFKAKYLFDPEKIKSLNDVSKNYYLSGNEAAVQFSQLGHDYGLTPGQKFPG